MKYLFIFLLTFITACSSPAKNKIAIMYNPETKDTKECRIDPWATWQWEYAEVLQQCINGYKKAGYTRIDD